MIPCKGPRGLTKYTLHDLAIVFRWLSDPLKKDKSHNMDVSKLVLQLPHTSN